MTGNDWKIAILSKSNRDGIFAKRLRRDNPQQSVRLWIS